MDHSIELFPTSGSDPIPPEPEDNPNMKMPVFRCDYILKVSLLLLVFGAGCMVGYLGRSVRVDEKGDNTSTALFSSSKGAEDKMKNGTRDDATLWQEHVDQLEGLGCRPRKIRVRAKEFLHETDALGDEHLFPPDVAVPRCFNNQSFCSSGGKLGIHSGSCQPARVVQQKIVLKYIKDGKENFVSISVEAHPECQCRANTQHG